MTKVIKPNKPTILPDLHVGISLTKEEVDIRDIEEKAREEVTENRRVDISQ